MWEKLYIDQQVLLDVGIHVAIILSILVLTRILAKLVKRAMAKKTHALGVDTTQYKFLSHFVSGFIYFIGIGSAIYTIPPLRGLATSLFAGSGLVALVISFASRHAFSTIVGGIFIALFNHSG